MLMEGAGNAKTGKEICKVLSITPRELTAIVEKERREGKPICANSGKMPGYFIAATQDEMQRYCNSLKHRANEIQKTRRACIKTINDLPARDLQ